MAMRRILLVVLLILPLVSCVSNRVTRVGADCEESEILLDLSSAAFLGHGYVAGDWVAVEADGILIRARVSEEPSATYPTLLVGGEHVILHIPAQSAVLGPYKKDVSGSLHVGGTFVFTL
ncbi:MAG: hypothetical protein GX911_04025 [Spirochaetales bacterium]|nr:hypothetical protein [Spirochaetales bacterium]